VPAFDQAQPTSNSARASDNAANSRDCKSRLVSPARPAKFASNDLALASALQNPPPLRTVPRRVPFPGFNSMVAGCGVRFHFRPPRYVLRSNWQGRAGRFGSSSGAGNLSQQFSVLRLTPNPAPNPGRSTWPHPPLDWSPRSSKPRRIAVAIDTDQPPGHGNKRSSEGISG